MGLTEVAEGVNVSGRILGGSERNEGRLFFDHLDLNGAMAFCKETRPGALIPFLYSSPTYISKSPA